MADQNLPEMIRLLEAQSVAYDQAKKVQFIELWAQLFSLIVPIIGILALPSTYERFALIPATIFLVVNGATFLLGKKKTEDAANIQEQFDNQLYNLRWQEITKGEKVPINEIVNLSKKCKRTDLQDWYSHEILPSIRRSNAILLCQDSNLIWDADLRQKFKRHSIIFVVSYYTVFITYLLFKDRSFTDSLLLLSPTFPFLLFCVISIFNMSDLISEKRSLSLTIKRLFERFKTTGQEANDEELAEIQNRIYSSRRRPEKIPSWYHNTFRETNQQNMHDCVRATLSQYNLNR